MSGLRLFPPQDANDSQLHRHGTLLSAHPHNTTAQLSTLLGNSNARLKRGAAAPQPLNLDTLVEAPEVPLEQAKYRARVEVDIHLASDVLVQGGSLRGNFKLRVRKTTGKDTGIWLSGAKIRIVGYETVGSKRHIFYQSATLLPDDSLSTAFLKNHSEEGYYAAREGIHVIPFDLFIISGTEHGAPKSTFQHSTCSVQYIAIASINVKTAKKRTIAHFYRHCQVLPRFNPATTLAHLPTPLQIESAPRASDNDDIALTAAISRNIWVAGQQCHVQLFVTNHSKKDVKSVTLNLIRFLSTYKPCSDGEDIKSTATKIVAQSVLSMAQQSSRGHASAKGWWTGIPSGRSQDFMHYLTVPLDAISVPRGRLVEVQYELQVLLPSDVSVSIPLNIINFLSLDPPPALQIGNINASYPLDSYQQGSLPPSVCSSHPVLLSANRDTDADKEVNEVLDMSELSDISEDSGDEDADAFVRKTIVDDEEDLPLSTTSFADLYDLSNQQKHASRPDTLRSQESHLVEFYGPRSDSPSKTVVQRPASSVRGHSFSKRVQHKLDERRKSLAEQSLHEQSAISSEDSEQDPEEQSPLHPSQVKRVQSPSKRDVPGYFDSVYSSPVISAQYEATHSQMTTSISTSSAISTTSRPLPHIPQRRARTNSHARKASGEFYGVQIPMSNSAAIMATRNRDRMPGMREVEIASSRPQYEPLISPTKSVKEKIKEMEERMRNEVY